MDDKPYPYLPLETEQRGEHTHTQKSDASLSLKISWGFRVLVHVWSDSMASVTCLFNLSAHPRSSCKVISSLFAQLKWSHWSINDSWVKWFLLFPHASFGLLHFWYQTISTIWFSISFYLDCSVVLNFVLLNFFAHILRLVSYKTLFLRMRAFNFNI